MNEKLYCWGQVNESTNSADPVLVCSIEDYAGLAIDRYCAYVWKENTLFTWGRDFSQAPQTLLKTSSKILKASVGLAEPLVQEEDDNMKSVTKQERLLAVTPTNLGQICLSKLYEVRAWNSETVVLSSIVEIASECFNFLALSSSGDVYKWSHIHEPKQLVVSEKIKEISCGAQHSVLLTEAWSVYAIGSNAYGQLSLGAVQETVHPILLQGILCEKVVCGGFHTIFLGKDKSLYSTGLGNMGQLISGTFSNKDTLSLCRYNEDLGDVLEVYCTENTSLVKFSSKFEPNSSAFRPLNLAKKNAIIRFLHRQLVAAAERTFLQKISNEERQRNEKKKKQLKREEKIQKALQTFESQILPKWQSMKSSKEVSELIKQGLPSKVRGRVWGLLIGNHYKINRDQFELCLANAKHIYENPNTLEAQSIYENSLRLIRVDISRTFNNLGYFSEESPLNQDLQNLLEAACIYRPDIGYIQGMSYVGGTLLLNLELIQAFQVFISIIASPLLLPFYKIDQEGILEREKIFLQILKDNFLELSEHVEQQGVQFAIFLMEWFVTLYSKTLSQEVAVRVWDLYFYFGDVILFKTGVAIIDLLQIELMKSDLAGIMECFTSIYDRVKEPDELVSRIEQIKIYDVLLEKIKNL